MEKGDFGKIRKAVKELTHEKIQRGKIDRPESELYPFVFGDLRLSKGLDPHAPAHIINAANELQELRTKIGKQRYDTYMTVALEIENKYREHIHYLVSETDESNLGIFQNTQQRSKAFRRLIDVMELEIMRDSRIQESFKGKEELLRKVILARWQFQKHDFGHRYGLRRSGKEK